MSGFGDADPEDAYDASDPPADLLRVLAAVLEQIDDDDSYRARVRRHGVAARLVALAARIEAED